MRLVIDLQGAQTESSFRGIGRYSLALAEALARQRGGDDVVLALNGLFPESVERVRDTFDGLLSQDNIKVWSAPGPVRAADPSNALRRHIAERIREAFLLDQQPDAVLLTSLFEGLGDDAVTSIGAWEPSIPTAAVLYDLIPLISPDDQYRNSAIHRNWYASKIESLRRSKLLLAISESSRQEALSALGTQGPDVISILGACDQRFRELRLSAAARERVRRGAGLTRPFVMYTGGADERKNLIRLVDAFAALPLVLRQKFQLALVGRMPAGHVAELQARGAVKGLTDELVFTGYVGDTDLVRLYNSCELLVFPSLHEGLGLPPLEAMACGAPVIAANATSLPEIVGFEEALFNPLSVPEITAKLDRALTDTAFKKRLLEHGQKQHRVFSWDSTAARAWHALRRLAPSQEEAPRNTVGLEFRATGMFKDEKKRILVQKLDHRGDFILALPAISKLRARYPQARLEALVGSWNADMAANIGLFERVHTLDYFRTASAAAPSLYDEELAAVATQIGRCDVAIDFRRQADTRFVLARIDSALRVGYQTFDAALDASMHIKLRSFADEPFVVTPLNRTHIVEQMLHLVDAIPSSISDFVNLPPLGEARTRTQVQVALFPAAGNDVKQWATKNFVTLAQQLAADGGVAAVNLYFGAGHEAAAFQFDDQPKIQKHIALAFDGLVGALSADTVCVANNSFGAHIAGYVGCTVIGVYGGHETVDEWAPPFGQSFVLHANVFCSPCHVASRGQCPYDMACLTSIPVQAVLDQVLAACFPQRPIPSGRISGGNVPARLDTGAIVSRASQDIARLCADAWTPQQLAEAASCISSNHRPLVQQRQLLVDVSELVKRDGGSGIQRVVRSILQQLLHNPPPDFVVEPVYATDDDSAFRYARAVKGSHLNPTLIPPADDPVETWSGDIFLGLDLSPAMNTAQQARLMDWRRCGTRVVFVVYDLLPVLMPQAFEAAVSQAHYAWLGMIAQFDGVIAISRTVALELLDWLQLYGPMRVRPLPVGWFHLGAEVSQSPASSGMAATATSLMALLAARPTFLMVGTVEPRKGHADVLSAFDELWAKGVQANLVIVGKMGWLVNELAVRLRTHPQAGQQLHWLEGITDEYLDLIYARSTALIAGSVGEGFGLPLVEGARRGLSLIARDIPVFREVAGDAAYYFPGRSTHTELAEHLQQWLSLHQNGAHPRSSNLKALNWEDSLAQLLHCVVDCVWPERWMSNGAMRFGAADPRLHITAVSRRDGQTIRSIGFPGNLVYGPYLTLKPGHYRVRLWGQLHGAGGTAWFDVVHDSGRRELVRGALDTSSTGRWTTESFLFLAAETKEVETRLWIGGDTDISFEGLELLQIVDDPLPEPVVDRPQPTAPSLPTALAVPTHVPAGHADANRTH